MKRQRQANRGAEEWANLLVPLRKMMEISDILDRDHILFDLDATSKKNILQHLGHFLADKENLSGVEVFDALCVREKLGSTGVGRGVAIPHARVAGLDHICAAFAKLSEPVDFDSVDGAPVSLVFMMLAPENVGAEHLQALAKVSRLLRDENICRQLLGASDKVDIARLLLAPSSAAA